MILLPPNPPNKGKQLESFQVFAHRIHLWSLVPCFERCGGLTDRHRAPVPASTAMVCLPFWTAASLKIGQALISEA